MKKVFSLIESPTAEHLSISNICEQADVQYILKSSLTSFKDTVESSGAPNLILGDSQSISELSKLEEFAHIEKKVITFSPEEKVDGLECLEISRLDEYIASIVSEEEQYEEVPISFFHTMDKAIVNIFIRLQKQTGSKYILRYTKNDVMELSELKSYESKGMINFFINSNDKEELYNTLSNSVCYDIATSNSLEAMSKGLELAQNMFLNSGYTPASIQLIEELNLSLYNKLEQEAKNTSKGTLIKSILASKDSLYFKKIALHTILGMDILKKEDWAMERHFELFNFMTTFSDIALTKSEMLYVTTDDDFDRNKFSKQDAAVLENHASRAFELLDNYQAKPINVDLLILEHHGVKSGVGFSKNISGSLNKIVVISRVAEGIAVEMLKKERDKESINMGEIIELVDRKFESPRVRSTLKNVI